MRFTSGIFSTGWLHAFILALGFCHTAIADAPQTGVRILLYHRFGPTVTDEMTVRTQTFEAQLAWLRSNDYRIVPLRDVVNSVLGEGPTLPPRAVAITADDGHRSVYTEMFPIIVREKIPVTLFIYPSAISNASYALTWEQLAEMRDSGFVEIQSHTYWHPNFRNERAKLSPEAYRDFVNFQMVRSKQRLFDRLAVHIDMLAWPFGIYDRELEDAAARAGYSAAFTIERRPVQTGANLMELPRYLMTDGDTGARFAAIMGAQTAEKKAIP